MSDAGLCASCVHARVHRNDRGSEFWRCARSEAEPEYPKYPRLPVATCAGHRPGEPTSTSARKR